MTYRRLRDPGRDRDRPEASLYRNGYFRAAEATLRPLLDVPFDPNVPRERSEQEALFDAAFQLAALYADVGELEHADRASLRLREVADTMTPADGSSREVYGVYMRAHVLHGLGRHAEAEFVRWARSWVSK